MHDWQNLVTEPDHSIDIREIIHHSGENDRSRSLCKTFRTEVVEVYAIADETDRHTGNQALEVALFGCRTDQRVRESAGYTPFVCEETPLFDRVDPAQRQPRPARELPPARRVELGELHNPRHLPEMLGILRDVAAINHDYVGLQFAEFPPDYGMQVRLVECRHRKRFPAKRALSARSLLFHPITGTAVTLCA